MSGSRLAISRTKSLYLDDSYMQPILSYLEHMRRLHTECRYLLPTTKLTGFGDQRTLYIDPDRHLTRRLLWNVVTDAGPETWPTSSGRPRAPRWRGATRIPSPEPSPSSSASTWNALIRP
jgi:hypothetical protein